jgi:hypothetical protein
MTRKLGGGIGSAVNKNVGVRTGAPRHAVNERGVSQIGQQLGNKATDKARTLSGAAESVITSKVGLSVPLGNEVALNVGKGGPGAGRNLYGQSGTNQQYGAGTGSPRPPGRGILNNQ